MLVLSSTKSFVVTFAILAVGRTQSTSPPRMARKPPRFVLTTLHHCTLVLGGENVGGAGGEDGAPVENASKE